jgi:hypothetical protein
MRNDSRRLEPPEGSGVGVDRTPGKSSSGASYKSTHSSRSSVLERAREYNRRIDEQKLTQSMTTTSSSADNNTADSRGRRRRSKSWERSDSVASSSAETTSIPGIDRTLGKGSPSPQKSSSSSNMPRSQSTGRIPNKPTPSSHAIMTHSDPTRVRAMESVRQQTRGPSSERTHPLTPSGHSSTQYSNNSSSQSSHHRNVVAESLTKKQPQPQQPPPRTAERDSATPPPQPPTRENGSRRRVQASPPEDPEEEPVAVVSPELLVEALSGHEDGLLAIAEKLMEHYDAGYDVMGEAIIDAFADVQKLFQHVVEAAHMEGAAFEAARREEEFAMSSGGGALPYDPERLHSTPTAATSPSAPARHDEFLDQDVKDLLSETIRTGAVWRSEGKNVDAIFHLYMTACIDAGALLPVDSDHRTRLQLSVNRAESMAPDRACAILRYGIDDVLRSGLRAGQAPVSASLADPDQQQQRRADVVLSRNNVLSSTIGNAAVVQSSDEALASLMEELKDMLQAPIYADTPLEHVSRRFWTALTDAHKVQQKNEERLEQNLGKLKGEFLLAQAVRWF